MDRLENNISMQDVIIQLEQLPQEYISKVYKFITEINETKEKKIRAWCKADSLMNTSPIFIENFKWNRDELYDE